MTKESCGSLVAAALAGAWRQSPEPLDMTDQELARIKPQLLGSGAAALVWWRARLSDLKESAPVFELRQAYRFQTLQADLQEQEITEVLAHLRQGGVEPILVKGWAVARLYAEKGLRPRGDVDLVVRRDELSAAETVLRGRRCEKYNVDLQHREFARLDSYSLTKLFDRSLLVRLGGTDVRVLAPEDHLVFLCLHMLRHGAWRPLWLCDIAAELESRPADFDWDVCLGAGRRVSDWVACAIGLAHQLLGARVDDTPVAARASHLPTWLIPRVLEQWETPYPMENEPLDYRTPMAACLRNPAGLAKDLLARWPNPIAATISVGGPFNELPRLPFQIGNGLARFGRFLAGFRNNREWGGDEI